MKNSLTLISAVCLLLIFVQCKKDKTNNNVSPDTAYTEQVSYGNDARQNYELYLPDGHDSNTKIVVLVHGGAWVFGPVANDTTYTFSSELGWDLVTPLLEEGYGVAVMKYRLACYNTVAADYTGDPMYYMNDMKQDVDLAIDQLKADASTLDYSSGSFALIGESAGAHISLMYALDANSDASLKTVVSFYSPASLDDQNFKTNTANYPFNNVPADLNKNYGVRKSALNCGFTTTGTVNMFYGVKSMCGADINLGSSNPGVTDELNPSLPSNINRNLPTFILHGAVDALVPAHHADSIINGITNKFGTIPAGANDFASNHKMKKYNNCNHGWGGSCNRSVIIDDVILWLSNHM